MGDITLAACGKSRLEGTVRTAAGAPVPSAMVIVSRTCEDVHRGVGGALADLEGRFSLGNLLPHAAYSLTPLVEGRYGPSTMARALPGEIVNVEVVFPDASAALEGVVRDPEGRPLSGLRVTFDFAGDDIPAAEHLYTDQAGKFSAPNLFPGQYHLGVDNPGFVLWTATVETADPPLEVVLARTREVLFRVADAEGFPVRTVRVSGEAESPRTQPEVLRDEEGRFRMEVPGNETALVIEIGWKDPSRVRCPLEWPPAGPLDLGSFTADGGTLRKEER